MVLIIGVALQPSCNGRVNAVNYAIVTYRYAGQQWNRHWPRKLLSVTNLHVIDT